MIWLPKLRVVGAFVLMGALVGACESGPKEGEEATYYGKKLVEPGVAKKEREAAMTHLEQLNSKDSLPYLHQALEGTEVEIKPKAAQLVGNLGTKDSVGSLIKAIDFKAGAGRDKKARAAASTNERVAKALGKLASPDNSNAIEALKRLVDNRHLETQLAAIVALGNLKATDAVQSLMDIAEGHTNNFMVKNAAEALGKIGDEKAVPILVRLMFFERAGVSFYAESSYALFQIGKSAVDPLFAVYNNKFEPIAEFHVEPGVQKAKALQVLMDIGGDPRIKKLCIEAAGIDPSDTANSLARVYGSQCVGRLGYTEALPVLKKGWDALDQSISEHALNAMAQMGAKSVAKELLAMTTFDGFVRQCQALDRRNKKEVCEKASPQVRPPRVETLSRIGSGDMLGAFEKMIADEQDAKLKKKLVKGKDRIAAAKDCEGKGVDCWIEKLKHDNAQQRERAAYELTWDGSDKAVDALLGALGDQDNEARFAAILGVWRALPKKGVARIDEILADEKGKTQFVRINQDLKRLRIKLERGY